MVLADTNSDSAPVQTAHALDVDVVTDIRSLKDEWVKLQSEGTGFIYQNYNWVRIAYETYDQDQRPFIIVARQNGELKLVLPLVLEPGIPSILRWAGGSHANTCCGL